MLKEKGFKTSEELDLILDKKYNQFDENDKADLEGDNKFSFSYLLKMPMWNLSYEKVS